MKTFLRKIFALAGFFIAVSLIRLNAATFFGPTPYLSSADIPAGLYVSGAPTFLENFEDGNLDPRIIASTGIVVPPGSEGLIDSVDADDGVIDGSGLKGHSWYANSGTLGVKFTFPSGTVAAGLAWTDGGTVDSITFSAFGPGNVPLGTIGPFSGIADRDADGGTSEDRFFGVRDAAGVESIFIISSGGGIELDHVQYELASVQDFAVDSFAIDSGGGTSTDGVFAVSGTIRRPDAEPMSGGGFTVSGEIQSIIAAPATGDITNLPSTTIFDNTPGTESGGLGASATIWMAGKFCLGSQPYRLDSLSLLLSSGNFVGSPQPPSTVRLQIYSHDPVSGKPAASTGLIMNLSEETNPITLKPFHLVKWTPATPFILSADTCYWAVLSAGSGAIAGWIPSATMPTGAAGTFGGAVSRDAGATWGTPDNLTNFKMLIQGTASGTPPTTPELAADGSTAIPGGTGNFTSLPLAPSLSGNNLAFYGTGSGGQQGIYLIDRAVPGNPVRIADLKTPIPNGTGNFLSFGTEAGITIVDGDVLFYGRGSGTQQGIYLSSRAIPDSPIRITDTATAIPAGLGNFTAFKHSFAYRSNIVAFVGSGSGGQQGLYAAAILAPPPVRSQTVGLLAPPQAGEPLRLADTATAIPEGSGNFTEFPSGPALSGSEVAFIGNGSGGQQGLYKVAVLSPPQVGSPLRIADTTTAIPGGTGDFTAFGSDQAHPVDPAMSGDRLAFVGTGSGGQQGVYTVAVLTPPQVGSPLQIADTTTPIPAGSGDFTSFSAVSVSETDVAFLGHGAGGQTGIYDMTGGQLLKVIAVGDRIGGKAITGLNFSRSGLSGDPVAFQATFSDGSQGVYTMDVVPPPSELRITAAERIGNDLRLSFTSVAGRNYAVQSRADLAAGEWAEVPGTTSTGSGAVLQLILPIALAQPQQFFRVKQLP